MKTKLLVSGVHLDSEGYPNVRYRIRAFRKSQRFELAEINVPMWGGSKQLKRGRVRLMSDLFRAVFAHLSVIIKYVIHGRVALVYVPYPSVFIGLVLSLLPRVIRPNKVVLDAFISLYDTVVNDRKLLAPDNWVSILLKRLEKLAFTSADIVIVDTPQNIYYLCEEFGLPESKVVDIPLSTNEQNFRFQPYKTNNEVCRVLFVGTFIPLHGVDAIFEAVALLRDCEHIQFRVVGSGQTSQAVEGKIEMDEPNLEWIPEWQTSDNLASMIGEADICLGIFGAGKKTQRVCPLKIYNYAVCGRPIITGETAWSRYATKDLAYKPFETVPVNDGAALANRIKQLANSRGRRQQLAKNSQRFYEEQLSNEIALSRLESLLCGN
ncbi:MAG: glycosyltransferase family 4 protein [Gammaproteobacteria bacterium]|nr:glycosyltransferase family 4 protein [Gammaproteobacteria bacterium]